MSLHFHLYHSDRWQLIFYLLRMSLVIFLFILPSVRRSFPVLFAEKQLLQFLTSKRPRWSGVFTVMCRAVCLPNMFYVGSVLVSSDQTISSQYFTDLFKCCAANLKQASTCFFLQQWSLAWRAYIQAMAVECIGNCFLPLLSIALHKWSFAPGRLFTLSFSLLCQKSCEDHLVVAGLR